MKAPIALHLFFAIMLASSFDSIAQETYQYQADFPPEEFAERRGKIFSAIGNNAIALIQGAAGDPDADARRTREPRARC